MNGYGILMTDAKVGLSSRLSRFFRGRRRDLPGDAADNWFDGVDENSLEPLIKNILGLPLSFH